MIINVAIFENASDTPIRKSDDLRYLLKAINPVFIIRQTKPFSGHRVSHAKKVNNLFLNFTRNKFLTINGLI